MGVHCVVSTHSFIRTSRQKSWVEHETLEAKMSLKGESGHTLQKKIGINILSIPLNIPPLPPFPDKNENRQIMGDMSDSDMSETK